MNKFKKGDMVYIKPMTAAEKDAYEPGWHPRMNKYEGKTLEVED